MTKRVYKYQTKGEFSSAFRYKNAMLFGGPVKGLGLTFPWDMIIKLDKEDVPFPIVQSTGRKVFTNLVNNLLQSIDTPVLNIPCSDGSYPDLPKDAWKALAEDLKKFTLDNKGKELQIAVCCYGGHGRTGLALAILKHFMLNERVDPIESIRKTYSPKSVEMLMQVRYVEEITGIKSDKLGSYSTKFSSDYSSYTGNKDGYGAGKDGYTSGVDEYEDSRYTDYWIKKSIEKSDNSDGDKSALYKALAKGIEEGEYDLTPIDDAGSLASIAGQAAGLRKGTKRTAGFVQSKDVFTYPVHKAENCTSDKCPDKNSKYSIHCSKASLARKYNGG